MTFGKKDRPPILQVIDAQPALEHRVTHEGLNACIMQPAPAIAPRLMGIDQVAAYLGMSPHTV